MPPSNGSVTTKRPDRAKIFVATMGFDSHGKFLRSEKFA